MNNKLYKIMNWPLIEDITYCECDDPHSFLGIHQSGSGQLIQCFYPEAKSVTVIPDVGSKSFDMERMDDAGFFAVYVPVSKKFSYKYEIVLKTGEKCTSFDPYNYEPLFTDEDINRFLAGNFYDSYKKFGAHYIVLDAVGGCYFFLWAPEAVSVMVEGDFNLFDGRSYQMRRLGDSGIFEIFVPGAKPGDKYRYAIKCKGDSTNYKADPYSYNMVFDSDGLFSVIGEEKPFDFDDDEYYYETKNNEEFSILKLSPGFSKETVPAEIEKYFQDALKAVKECGFTHVLMEPVCEYSFTSGNHSDILSYFSIAGEYGDGTVIKEFIKSLHNLKKRFIISFDFSSFPCDDGALCSFDGQTLYEYADERIGKTADMKNCMFDLSRKEVTGYLCSSICYFINEFHVDGIFVDDIAPMLYLDYGRMNSEHAVNIFGGTENLEAIAFFKKLNRVVKKNNANVITIARSLALWSGITDKTDDNSLCFDFDLNDSFFDDYSLYVNSNEDEKAELYGSLASGMVYAYSENYITPLNLKSISEDAATLSIAYLYAYPGKKMIELPLCDISKYKALIKELNNLYFLSKGLSELDNSAEGFEWINALMPEEKVISFIRRGKADKDLFVVTCNFSNEKKAFLVGVPYEGCYTELINSFDFKFNGRRETGDKCGSFDKAYDGKEFSIESVLEPFSMNIWNYKAYSAAEKEKIREEKTDMLKAAREKALSSKKEAETAKKKAEEASKKAALLLVEAEKKIAEAIACENVLSKAVDRYGRIENSCNKK